MDEGKTMKRLIPILLALLLALTMSGVAYAEDDYPPTDEWGVEPDIVDPYSPTDLDSVMAELGIGCYGKIFEDGDWGDLDPNGDHSFGTSVVITITAAPDDEGEYREFAWESTVPIQVVLVKAATSALVYEYEYEDPVMSDSGLVAPEFKGISHVAFGWDCDDDNGSGDPQEVPIPGLNTWGTLAGVLVIGATGTFLVYRKRTATA